MIVVRSTKPRENYSRDIGEIATSQFVHTA
ncbi:hypothetical protein ABID26_000300 [Mesorhizobium shonense]|uniref:Uncharacterized protein n=1 Tax=Mesorhizobium shonense TaxID=1209948 RepID=A0ABV2HK26_9HYPH